MHLQLSHVGPSSFLSLIESEPFDWFFLSHLNILSVSRQKPSGEALCTSWEACGWSADEVIYVAGAYA